MNNKILNTERRQITRALLETPETDRIGSQLRDDLDRILDALEEDVNRLRAEIKS